MEQPAVHGNVADALAIAKLLFLYLIRAAAARPLPKTPSIQAGRVCAQEENNLA